MTTGTSEEALPISDITVKRVRVVRIKTRHGPELFLAFAENARMGSPYERITQKFLQASVGHRFNRTPAFESFAEDHRLSELATPLFMALRASTDEVRALEMIEQFVTRSGNLAVMAGSAL